MKLTARILAVLLCCLTAAGCNVDEAPAAPDTGYTKYSYQFYDTFDTVVQVLGYTETEEEFNGWCEKIHARFLELNDLFDRFNEYEGINNIATVNRLAGEPVEVAPELIELLDFSLEWMEKTDGCFNIFMGPVTAIWNKYSYKYAGRTDGELPDAEKLEAAAELMRTGEITIDREASTVMLDHEGMALDVGAVAKGWATQLVTDEIYAEGFTSFLISAGGNVTAADMPLDGVRNAWAVGIQDPFKDENDASAGSLDVVFINSGSLVTSGDYERYYFAGDMRVHHIIDPKTLMPAVYSHSVTILAEDGGVADCLSTALFCMDHESGLKLAESLGFEALWVLEDGTIEYTEGFLPYLRDRGGATNAVSG